MGKGLEIRQLIFYCYTEWSIYGPLMRNGSIQPFRYLMGAMPIVGAVSFSFETINYQLIFGYLPVEVAFICYIVYSYLCIDYGRE